VLSEGNGATWLRTLPFSDAEEITFSCVLGNVLFATHSSPWLTRSAMRLHSPSSEGWFRMDLRQRWSDPGEALFLKPKVT